MYADDWHDDNHDGLTYRDLDHNGVVNTGEDERGELNRFTYGYNIHDVEEIDDSKPLARSHEAPTDIRLPDAMTPRLPVCHRP